MPTEERGSIGQVQPSGWHTVRYDFVDGQYLYNRCHLIGYQLAGENANEQNLITGTRYLNVEGMLPFENMVADYITETGNHVLYRVTPEFEGDNLLASGVRIEAASVEDDADGICFHVYCYNVQPGVIIDYATGGSHAEGEMAQSGPESDDAVSEDTQAQSGAAPGQESEQPAPVPPEPEQTEPAETTPEQEEPAAEEYTYVVNTNTYKFHLPGCASADDIKPENRLDYTGTREALIEQGYDPCGRCKP